MTASAARPSTPLTTGTPGLMIPAFSKAMADNVEPSIRGDQGDRGDNRNQRIDDIGGVESAAHADLENGDIDLALGEMEEGQDGQDLEIGGMGLQAAGREQPVDRIRMRPSRRSKSDSEMVRSSIRMRSRTSARWGTCIIRRAGRPPSG